MQNGPLFLVVNGNATIENILRCNREENLPEGDSGAGILLALKGAPIKP